MAFIIAGVITMIVCIIIMGRSQSRQNKLKEIYKDDFAADYQRYVDGYNESRYHYEDHCLTFEEWLKYRRPASYRECTYDPKDDTVIPLFSGAGLVIILAVVVLLFCNISNAANYRRASDYVTVYQSYIDNASDEFISAGTGDSIISFNEDIIDHRYYQNNWYFSSHYLFSGDWDTIPLVE